MDVRAIMGRVRKWFLDKLLGSVLKRVVKGAVGSADLHSRASIVGAHLGRILGRLIPWEVSDALVAALLGGVADGLKETDAPDKVTVESMAKRAADAAGK